LLGQLIGGVLGGNQASASSPIAGILQQVMAMKDSQGNSGVAAIVSKFTAAGLGSQAQSWVGTGANAPVTAEHIGQVFSQDQIDTWAAEAQTTPAAISRVLAEALPHAVDQATPAGQIPSQSIDIAGLLRSLLGGQPSRPA
jgi:uncharacterized protein YidB (DUF937 family)